MSEISKNHTDGRGDQEGEKNLLESFKVEYGDSPVSNGGTHEGADKSVGTADGHSHPRQDRIPQKGCQESGDDHGMGYRIRTHDPFADGLGHFRGNESPENVHADS